MKVLIVGGGIGGLATAIAFQQQGHETVIYERVRELRPVGAAISVWSNGIKVLNALGLSSEVSKYGGQMDEMSYRWYQDGRYMCKFPLEPLYTQVKQRAFPIGRTHLQRMLLDKAGRSNVHLGRKAMNYHIEKTGVTLELEDGHIDTGDFLVIADGTHSKLRNKIVGQNVARRYAGYVNWNGQVDASALKGLVEPHCWTTFVGQGKRVAMMPMGSGKFYFWFDASPPPADPLPTASAYKSELRELFKDWHPAVQKLIEATDENTMARIEIHDTDPLPALTDPSGKVVLIGDAAHATAPDLGQGGCQALEDAFVLGQLSKKEGLVGADTPVTEAKLQAVGRGYVLSRHERVTSMVLRARKRAEVTHALNGMEETEAWYKELEGEDGSHILSGMSKTILGAPVELEGQSEIQVLQPAGPPGEKPILESLPQQH